MIMELSAEQSFDYEGSPVEKVVGFENGSFMLMTENGARYAFDCAGNLVVRFDDDEKYTVLPLSGGYYLKGVCVRQQSGSLPQTDVRTIKPMFMGSIYDNHGVSFIKGINGFYVFANNWYIVGVHHNRVLYDDKHQVIAEWYGPRLRMGKAFSEELKDNWIIAVLKHGREIIQRCSDNGYEAKLLNFIGDACMLVCDKEMDTYLTDLECHKLCRLPVLSYERLCDNRFVLHFTDGSERLYRADGKPESDIVKDAVILADGCFVTKEHELVVGIYGKNGIADISRPVPTKVQTFGYNYYLLTWYDRNTLYDKFGNDLGMDYQIIDNHKNFLLVRRNGKVMLFNQLGCALVGDA